MVLIVLHLNKTYELTKSGNIKIETMLKNWGIQMCETVVAGITRSAVPCALFWGSYQLCCSSAAPQSSAGTTQQLLNALNWKFVPLVNAVYKWIYSKTRTPNRGAISNGTLKNIPILLLRVCRQAISRTKIWERQHVLVLFLNTDMKNWVN